MHHLFAGLLAGLLHAAAGQKPHIISILQDDLGYDDINLNSKWTQNISALHSEGIQLTNHYTHWHWYVVAMTGAALHTYAVKTSPYPPSSFLLSRKNMLTCCLVFYLALQFPYTAKFFVRKASHSSWRAAERRHDRRY